MRAGRDAPNLFHSATKMDTLLTIFIVFVFFCLCLSPNIAVTMWLFIVLAFWGEKKQQRINFKMDNILFWLNLSVADGRRKILWK